MPLTGQQLGALDAAEWLFSPSTEHRRSGRTLVLAVAVIRLACRNPGITIFLADHMPGREPTNGLYRLIEGFVRTDHVLAPRFTLSRDASQVRSLRIDLPRPIDNWLPSEEMLGTFIPIRERARASALAQMRVANEDVERQRVDQAFVSLMEAEHEPNMNGDVFPEALIRAVNAASVDRATVLPPPAPRRTRPLSTRGLSSRPRVSFDPEQDFPDAPTVDIRIPEPEPLSKWDRLLGEDEI